MENEGCLSFLGQSNRAGIRCRAAGLRRRDGIRAGRSGKPGAADGGSAGSKGASPDRAGCGRAGLRRHFQASAGNACRLRHPGGSLCFGRSERCDSGMDFRPPSPRRLCHAGLFEGRAPPIRRSAHRLRKGGCHERNGTGQMGNGRRTGTGSGWPEGWPRPAGGRTGRTLRLPSVWPQGAPSTRSTLRRAQVPELRGHHGQRITGDPESRRTRTCQVEIEQDPGEWGP